MEINETLIIDQIEGRTRIDLFTADIYRGKRLKTCVTLYEQNGRFWIFASGQHEITADQARTFKQMLTSPGSHGDPEVIESDLKYHEFMARVFGIRVPDFHAKLDMEKLMRGVPAMDCVIEDGK